MIIALLCLYLNDIHLISLYNSNLSQLSPNYFWSYVAAAVVNYITFARSLLVSRKKRLFLILRVQETRKNRIRLQRTKPEL